MERSIRKPVGLLVLGLVLATALGQSGFGDAPLFPLLGMAQSSTEFSIKNSTANWRGYHFTLNPVRSGDSIQAGSSNVRIRMRQGSEIRLARNSEVRFPNPHSVELRSGEILVASRSDLEFDLKTLGLYAKPDDVRDSGGILSSLQVLHQSESQIRMRSLAGDWTVFSGQDHKVVARLAATDGAEIAKNGPTWVTSKLESSALPERDGVVFRIPSPAPEAQLGAAAGATAAGAGTGIGMGEILTLGALSVGGGVAVEDELDDDGGHSEDGDQDPTSPIGP